MGAPVTAIPYPLNKILTAIARKHILRDALTDDELVGHDLSEAERGALTTGDIGKLYELGANPYLIRRVFRRRFSI
jgi:hypothetical protein